MSEVLEELEPGQMWLCDGDRGGCDTRLNQYQAPTHACPQCGKRSYTVLDSAELVADVPPVIARLFELGGALYEPEETQEDVQG